MSIISLSKQIRDMGSQELINFINENKSYHSWIVNCYDLAKTLNHRKDFNLLSKLNYEQNFYEYNLPEEEEKICHLVCKCYIELTGKDIVHDLV